MYTGVGLDQGWPQGFEFLLPCCHHCVWYFPLAGKLRRHCRVHSVEELGQVVHGDQVIPEGCI